MRIKYLALLILSVFLTACESTRVAERLGVIAARENYRYYSHEWQMCLLKRELRGEKDIFQSCRFEAGLRESYIKQYLAMERTYIEKWGVEP